MIGRVLAVLAVVLGVWWYVLLPPPPIALMVPASSRVAVRGAIHVHTRRSDGTGTVDSVAAAAQRAGLRFVVFTDHSDASRLPDQPAYLHGVLCIDAVEISTDGGHVVALDIPQAPYPLGGEARDVVDDIHRLGGFAIAAHPGSMKPALRWRDWNVPVDGVEWLNADSEWRDEPPLMLARVLFAYPARGAAALAMLLDRPADVLQRWDALTVQRRVVTLAAADAHARLGWRSAESAARGVALPLPSYEQLFRTFSVSLPDTRLSGDARSDARAVLDAIRQGHAYSSIDALANPVSISFVADRDGARAVAGDAITAGLPVALHVQAALPPNAEIRLLHNGANVAASRNPAMDFSADQPGAYRVEVRLPGRRDADAMVPWILTNPIYVGLAGRSATPNNGVPQPTTVAVQYADGPALAWAVEHSERAIGAIDVVKALSGTELLVRYALTATPDESAFVDAAVRPNVDLAAFNRVTFVARADRPMRISVQLRTPNGIEGNRWLRSVYLDQSPRQVTVSFDDMTPVGSAPSPHPELSKVQSVLFVVDTVNSKPGSSGQFWLDDVKYGR